MHPLFITSTLLFSGAFALITPPSLESGNGTRDGGNSTGNKGSSITINISSNSTKNGTQNSTDNGTSMSMSISVSTSGPSTATIDSLSTSTSDPSTATIDSPKSGPSSKLTFVIFCLLLLFPLYWFRRSQYTVQYISLYIFSTFSIVHRAVASEPPQMFPRKKKPSNYADIPPIQISSGPRTPNCSRPRAPTRRAGPRRAGPSARASFATATDTSPSTA